MFPAVEHNNFLNHFRNSGGSDMQTKLKLTVAAVAAAVAGLASAQDIGVIIRHHHEHVDGAGYPDGLSGESIPVLSRILAIADSYDAMATPRVYHRAKPHAEIMKVMRSEVNAKFDSFLFRKFSELIERSSARAPL
jgi:HD-GYP domain-containing protein (c-di-GMP phosphodiesterase class II)